MSTDPGRTNGLDGKAKRWKRTLIYGGLTVVLVATVITVGAALGSLSTPHPVFDTPASGSPSQSDQLVNQAVEAAAKGDRLSALALARTSSFGENAMP